MPYRWDGTRTDLDFYEGSRHFRLAAHRGKLFLFIGEHGVWLDQGEAELLAIILGYWAQTGKLAHPLEERV